MNGQRTLRPGALRAGLLAALLSCAPGAQAWRLDYDLSLGVEYTDNVGRRATAEEDELVLRPELRIALTEQGERVRASVVGAASWRNYTRGVFDDELRTDLGARLDVALLEGRLGWTVEDYLAEEPVDVFASASPGNIQRTNFFSTGPTLFLRFSPVLSGRAELRWQDTYAEVDRAFNSERLQLALRAIRALDDTTDLSGNVELARVRPDEPGLATFDNDRVALFARWARESARRSLGFDVGWSEVDFDGAEDSSGLLLRARGTWDPTEASTLDFALAREYSDAAADLVLRAPTEDDLAQPVTAGPGFGIDVTPDVFLDRRAGLGYTIRGERVQTALRGDFRRQTYRQNPALDRRTAGVGIGLDYLLSTTATLGAFASHYDQVALNTDFGSTETDAGVRLRYRARSNLWLVAELARARRDADLPANEFTETRAFIGVTLSRD